MLTRLLSIAILAAALAGLVYAAVFAMASSEDALLEANRAALAAQANLAATHVRQTLRETAHLAAAIDLDATWNNDVRTLLTLEAATNPTNPAGKAARALQLLIDNLHIKLGNRLAAWRKAHPQIESAAFIDLSGTVVLADSPHLAIGSNIFEHPEGTPADANTAAVASHGRPYAEILTKAMAGADQSSVQVSHGTIVFLAVHPVLGKPTRLGEVSVVGLLWLEQPLRRFPGTAAINGFAVSHGTTVLGTSPPGAHVDTHAGSSYLLMHKDPECTVLGQPMSSGPFGIDPTHIGVWAARFEFPETDDVSGTVYRDVTRAYSELGTRQWTLAAYALGVWLFVAVLILFQGFGVRRDLGKIADFLSKLQQGATTERRLAEGKLVPEVRRLARLINSTLTDGVAPAKSAASPPPAPVSEPLAPSPAPNSSLLDLPTKDGAAMLTAVAHAMTVPSAASVVLGDLLDMLDGSAELDTANPHVPPPPAQGMPPPLPRGSDGWTDVMDTPMAARDALLSRLADPGMSSRPSVVPEESVAASPFGQQASPLASIIPSAATSPAAPSSSSAGMSARDQFLARLSNSKKNVAPAAAAAVAPVASPVVAPPPATPFTSEPASTLAATLFDSEPEPEPAAALAPSALDLQLPAFQPAPAVPTRPSAHSPAEEENYQQVYTAFMELRKTCGETGELPYEKFVGRLDDTRKAVIERHHCKEVLFSAYLKNGKAALKASPR